MNWKSVKYGLLSLATLSCANRTKLNNNSNSCWDKRIDKLDPNLELVSVQAFFRHGARTPVHLINYNTPTIPKALWEPILLTKTTVQCYRNIPTRVVDMNGGPIEDQDSLLERQYQSQILPGGEKIGQLTRQGQEQMFNLGLKYRDRYGDMLDNIVESNFTNLYCRSTRIRRNIQSMECLLNGLFYGVEVGSPASHYIRIHLTKTELETLYPNYRACDALKVFFANGIKKGKENETFLASEDYIKSILRVENLRSILKNQDATLQNVRDYFYCRHYHGFIINKELRTYLPKLSMLAADQISYELFGGPPRENLSSLRFNTGPILEMMLDTFHSVRTGTLNHKMKLYLAHDTTIIPILVVLGIFEYDFPDFGSDLVFEVYRDNTTNQYWLQIIYQGEALILENEGAATLIPLDVIEEQFEKYAISYEDYKIQCKSIKSSLVDEVYEGAIRPPGL